MILCNGVSCKFHVRGAEKKHSDMIANISPSFFHDTSDLHDIADDCARRQRSKSPAKGTKKIALLSEPCAHN